MTTDIEHTRQLFDVAEGIQNKKEAQEAYTKVIEACLKLTQNESSSNSSDSRHSSEDVCGSKGLSEVCHLLSVAYNNRGLVCYRDVEFYDAIDDYTRAVEVDDRFAVAFYNRGLVRYRLGFYDDAIPDLQLSLQLNPSFSHADKCLQQTFRERGELRKKNASLVSSY